MLNIDIYIFFVIRNNTILLLHKEREAWYELPGFCLKNKKLSTKRSLLELKKYIEIDTSVIAEIGQKVVEENNLIYNYHWFRISLDEKSKINLIQRKYDYIKFIDITRLKQFNVSPNVRRFLIEYKIFNDESDGLISVNFHEELSRNQYSSE